MNYVRQLDKLGQEKPLLFSYRRCPYAMRARMALLSCGIDFDIFEISLRDKPKQRAEMFNAFESELKKYNKPYILLKGSKKERLKLATEEINKLLKQTL